MNKNQMFSSVPRDMKGAVVYKREFEFAVYASCKKGKDVYVVLKPSSDVTGWYLGAVWALSYTLAQEKAERIYGG